CTKRLALTNTYEYFDFW
nr:immunoglobulin heavy chain junction region [Macaca mulatta]MOV87787.1 immunoglobulin heavy chain junction region [Macaca mulatta]MOV87802.1 immunoglobulin heavy chain junction region [Macaca mulatta]MOV87855.1 immunoglobulin heavy chain junction region [Macaca mulatta]MOV87925.1 immunoglobulin heavy chain junction region [Macaca mulatta]